MRRPLPLAALALALAATACGKSPPSVTLTLDPVAPAQVRADYRGPPIAVPAVHVPAAIDRVEYVSETSPGQIKVDDFARWAAPLGTLARDTLVHDLMVRLPAGAVLPPGATGGAATRTIDVTLLSLSGGPGEAIMQAAFRTVPNGRVTQVELRTPAAAAGAVPSARAFAALFGQLADAIAASLPAPRG